MTVIGKTSHSMFFNGVSDGIVVPQANFSRTGLAKVSGKSYSPITGDSKAQSLHTRTGRVSKSFTIEAWVVPDCGGIIASKEGVFELRMGDVGTPGPAQFVVEVQDSLVGHQSIIVTTASPYIASSAQNGWDGIVYPTHPSDSLHGTHNRFNSGANNETALNRNVRDLYHIAGVFTGKQVKLYVNGDLVASEKLNKEMMVGDSENDLYIGGRGGQFRGSIEAVHWRRGFNENYAKPGPLVPSSDSIGLWRFEEPIDVPQLELHLKSAATASTSTSGSTLTLSNADGKALLQHVTGSVPTATTTLDLTTNTTYSNGKYILDGIADVPHTPINLLINPTGVDEKTGVSYQTSPPERVRVKSITWNANGTTDSTIVVYSIHLDFDNHASGIRGLLHAHAAFDSTNQLAKGSTIAVINSDILVDSGSGKPLRATGFATQVIDRTGQMVIDEVGGNHGFVFNRQIATDTTNNPFAFNWGGSGLREGLQVGHTGRHMYSHITGHPYLRSFPPSIEEVVERNVEGDSDYFSVHFDGTSTGLKQQVPIGSIVDVHRQAYIGEAVQTETSSTAYQAVENGMLGIDGTQRNLIAIGGPAFSPLPFLLKGHAALGEDGTTSTNDMHMIPEDESRIAILEVPTLATGGNTMAPYVEIHYNAIDLKGDTIQYAASGIAGAVWDNTNHRITLRNDMAKAFGKHNTTFDGYYLSIDGQRAFGSTGTVTFTIDHTNHRLTATAGGTSVLTAFENKVVVGAVIRLDLRGPALCVTKTVPDSATIVGGQQVLDHIHDAINTGSPLHAPGGIIVLEESDLGTGSVAFKSHRMVGDNTGGTTYELELDDSRLPANHTPASSSDIPNAPPQGIIASHTLNPEHSSRYHKMIIRPTQAGMSNNAASTSSDPPVATAPSNFTLSPIDEASSNANGAFDRPSTTHRSNLHEIFDIIDNWEEDKKHFIVVQPTLRSRTMQLSKFTTKADDVRDSNFLSIEYMQTRGRVQQFMDNRGTSRQLVMKGVGLLQDIRGAEASVLGDGSPDSHPIKEVIPGGPVVTVSLGGPGQGAIDTKPTYDPSPIARIGWNTRRPCGAVVMSTVTAAFILRPLNNDSDSLASWGHICFPPSSGSSGAPTARIYLSSGASAAYYDVSSGGLVFAATDTDGENGWFLNSDGTAEVSFSAWISNNSVTVGTVVYTDPYIDEDTMCDDGTTVQDRMFQKMDSVQHDYQLGTQYASTRALVEIPLFPNQFFENRDAGIFPGPDNSMKLTLDATMTAHTWAPNPVGSRICAGLPSADPTVVGPYQNKWVANQHRQGTTIVTPPHKYSGFSSQVAYPSSVAGTFLVYVEDAAVFPSARSLGVVERRGGGTTGLRKAILSNGEWCLYMMVDRTNNFLVVPPFTNTACYSDKFLESLEIGMRIMPSGMQSFNPNIPIIDDGHSFRLSRREPSPRSIGQEFRSSMYHDAANMQTQGGNLDYGLRQYVSAVEFKSGPVENPHIPKMKTGAWTGRISQTFTNGSVTYAWPHSDDGELFPRVGAACRWAKYNVATWKVLNLRNNLELEFSYAAKMFPQQEHEWRGREEYFFLVKVWSSGAVATVGVGNNIHDGDELVLMSLEVNPNHSDYAAHYPNHVFHDAILNRTWLYPYAAGGMRNGDTIWMNMHYTNPHGRDGLFCKSRGVTNDWEVHAMFGGRGTFGTRSRDSIPMENFLIGNTCRETAENFVNHVNQTVAHNLSQLGFSVGMEPRMVAFVDPYLSTDDHARVLLYDVKHDREFIAFHDIHMQVQSNMDAVEIDNLDVAYAYPSQQRSKKSILETSWNDSTWAGGGVTVKIRTMEGRSTFVEGAYAHDSKTLINNDHLGNGKYAYGRYSYSPGTTSFGESHNHGHSVLKGPCDNGLPARTQDGVCCNSQAELWLGQDIYDEVTAQDFYHKLGVKNQAGSTIYEGFSPVDTNAVPHFGSTTMDTPHGTRAIPAFLALKGIRASTLTPVSTSWGFGSLPHWTEMEFTRRLNIDLGEVGIKEGITNIEAAAREVVRLVNQGGARKGRSNIRRPADQFPGDNMNTDPHIKADYAVTGSTHDPAPFWDTVGADSYDRGSHMGYLRAHIGRVVEDVNGEAGFSIVIHSTVPGATGRNFCAWLDNSKGQSTYTPQFLIGHGGRFRNFYCQPNQMWSENMHPAPMPIDKHGKPFAPITTLHELASTTSPANGLANVGRAYPPAAFLAEDKEITSEPQFLAAGGGASSNTVTTESTTPNEQSVIQGLSKGTPAFGRINFGGFTQTGIPGWAPDLGTWGFGAEGKDKRAHEIYSSSTHDDGDGTTVYTTTTHVPQADELEVVGNDMYAIEFKDHLGRPHRVRLLYRQHGKPFSNERTRLPDSLDNEIIIWFDDRDVGQGGFTLGRHMKGKGDVGGRIRTGAEWRNGGCASHAATAITSVEVLGTITEEDYCGNRWNPVHVPEGSYAVTLTKPAGTTGTLALAQPGAGTIANVTNGIWHDLPEFGDSLGFLGFPKENGVIQITIPHASNKHLVEKTGHFISYTHRTTYTRNGGTHKFYGCVGIPAALTTWSTSQVGPMAFTDELAPVCISPRPNWTTLVTDELIAAAVEYALKCDDINSESVDSTSFDCTELHAADGRTFGEWGISPSAIRVQSYNTDKDIIPLSKLFEVSRQPDWGILDAHMKETQVQYNFGSSSGTNMMDPINLLSTEASTKGAYDSIIDGGMYLPCGYIPKTVLHISTKYVGANANTPTPIVVNSANNPIDILNWEQNLRGRRKTFWSGDHITPRLENPIIYCTAMTGSSPSTNKWRIEVGNFANSNIADDGYEQLFQLGPVGRAKSDDVGSNKPPFYNSSNKGQDASYAQRHKLWVTDDEYALLEPFAYDVTDGTTSSTQTTVHGARFQHAFNRLSGGSAATISSTIASTESENFYTEVNAQGSYIILQKHRNKPEFAGHRTTASNFTANALVFFRGGRNSVDHSVPLYFGGGFSGAVIDINDGTQNDYTDFYTHPYSAGPTGCAGIQHANEMMGSHAILDTVAMMSFFPGTSQLDQHKGEVTPPFYNQDLQLSPDMGCGSGTEVPTTKTTDTYNRAGHGGGAQPVRQTQPSPIVLRFAHPFARYEDVQTAGSETQTTYIIFGPGQSVPHFFQPELHYIGASYSASALMEPSVAISTSAIWANQTGGNTGVTYPTGYPYLGGSVPGYPAGTINLGANLRGYMATPAYAFLPNDMSMGDSTNWATGSATKQLYGWLSTHNSGQFVGFLPRSVAYHAQNQTNWQAVDNWEPAQGDPNQQYNQLQTYGLYFNDHFIRHDVATGMPPPSNIWSRGGPGNAHPFAPFSHRSFETETQYQNGAAQLQSSGPFVDDAGTPWVGDVSNEADIVDGSKLSHKFYEYCWHGDGGQAPGGHFFDDRVVRNPQNFGKQTVAWIQSTEPNGPNTPIRVGDNASMYRVAGPMLKSLKSNWGYSQDDWASSGLGDVDRDVIVVDATRVQNAEELATILSTAINEWPGTGALRAMGGTFLPTFQHAHKQDRYSWVKLPMDATAGSSGLNGRNDHLSYMHNGVPGGTNGHGGTVSHWGGGAADQEFTIGIGPNGTAANKIPYEIAPYGSGRLFLGVGGTSGHWITKFGVSGTAEYAAGGSPTFPSAATGINHTASTIRGLYFFYRGVSAADDPAISGTASNGYNRSFYLAQNFRTGLRVPEDPTYDIGYQELYTSGAYTYWSYAGSKYLDCASMGVGPNADVTTGQGMFIWTKTGNHRWDNGGLANVASQAYTQSQKTALGLDNSSQMGTSALAATMVHFNGLHDAVDRTRPIGAVGWAGNQYSMLNSVGAAYDPLKSCWTIPRGLGAWHAYLGFSPYGNTMGCHNSNDQNRYYPATTGIGGNDDSGQGTGDDVGNLTLTDPATDASASEYYSTGWSTTYDKPKGTHERHFVVVSHEAELPLIARADRLGQVGNGDLMSSIWINADSPATGPPRIGEEAMQWFYPAEPSDVRPSGTTHWSHKIHNAARYTAPANAGPYVEAQIHSTLNNPTNNASALTNMLWGAEVDAVTDNIQGDACAAPTGDLFIGTDWLGYANQYHDDITALGGTRVASIPSVDGADKTPQRSIHKPIEGAAAAFPHISGTIPALNFTTENIVWKRMDGGNLSLPAPNARGMGAIPWVWRGGSGMDGHDAQTYKTGETVYGNCRFSFETTNSAMMPIIQAQELAHPSLAQMHPHEIGDYLIIPNEETQFESVTVVDDTGQEHVIEGGSPFGTIIRDFKHVNNRTDEGMAPALAGSGKSPNMEIQLPDADTIPGNIIVRSGFDRIQSYQNETMGTGGLHHPGQPNTFLQQMFGGSGVSQPANWPTWENYNWENIDDTNYPNSGIGNWAGRTGNAPLQTAYEPHDRTLYFHITKHDVSYSKREVVHQFDHSATSGVSTGLGNNLRDGAVPTYVIEPLTINDTTVGSGVTLTVTGNTNGKNLWLDASERLKDGSNRWYLTAIKSTGERVIASYTGFSGTQFSGVVWGPGWDTTCNGLTINPSFYTPAGTTRLYASRRMRDHAEVSGNSPDMPLIDWWKLNDSGPTSTNPYDLIVAPKMTPMPIPRMGHHFITPTMAMLPGHLAHPVYQNLYGGHTPCDGVRSPSDLGTTALTGLSPMDPNIWFSNLTPNYPPSDIHGGAFTLMSETKMRFDGYGILASNNDAGEVNRKGGHIIVLEANGYYTQTSHFPDPLEVGAYQIIIQPNLFSQQLTGFHQNTAFDSASAPSASASSDQMNFTGQQVATVVGIIHEWGSLGASALILADRVAADVRGCEVYLNEIMLDIDPSPGQQFTALPPLALFNPLGVNETSSPAFSRRSLPYHPSMFRQSTPGYTLTVPWWAIPSSSTSWSEYSLINVDDYYRFCRSTYGAISAQVTLAGYPSHYYQPYVRELQSMNPVTIVTQSSSGGATVDVLDNNLFPYNSTTYGQVLVYIDSVGDKQKATYTGRGKSGDGGQDTTRFTGVVAVTSNFWARLSAGSSIYLSGEHENYNHGDNITDNTISTMPRLLPQVLSGSRDTNNLFMADAYLCMWHHNLGRPMTAFSEQRNTVGAPTAQKPYNIMPESFEMVHYHEFTYAISNGPFVADMKWLGPHYTTGTNGGGGWDNTNHRATLAAGHVNNFGADGSTFDGYYLSIDGARASTLPGVVEFTIAYGANTLTATTGGSSVSTIFEAKVTGTAILVLHEPSLDNTAVDPDSMVLPAYSTAPVTIGSNDYFFSSFWPGGTRYGGAASRLDMWGDVERGWNVGDVFAGECKAYTAEYTAGPALDPTKIRTDQDVAGTWTHFPTTAGAAPWTRNHCFGYRFSIRQPNNRPRWAIGIKSVVDGAAGYSAASGHYGYFNGPFVQAENKSWITKAAMADNATIASSLTGVIERQTNASHMLGFDLPGWQVRYSDGRRMTKPFGCPVRTLRNSSTARKQFPGDTTGKGIEDVIRANMYYVVDWWGNTTGEDVRRFPVRGFGLRPAFDPEAWRWTQGVQAMPTSLFRASATPSVQEGNRNDSNNTDYNAVGGVYTKLADFFNPLDSVRVGDRGDGRGARCPIFFNEYVAQSVDTVVTPTGMILSYHTAEPPFTVGLLRARNDILQDHESARGISSRLNVDNTDGLLKPEAMTGRNVEKTSGTFGMENITFQDPVSRLSPRIGLDAYTVAESNDSDAKDYIIQATQAISLHTDSVVGQRYILEGSFTEAMFPAMTGTMSYTLADLDFSKGASFTWTNPPSVVRFNNAHGIMSRGGTYIMEVSSYADMFDDTGWGNDTSGAAYSLGTHGPTSNPYQSNTVQGLLDPMVRRTNTKDKTIRFLLRPYRALDYRHVGLFREGAGPPTGPQSSSTKPFFMRTAGGRYGLFNYEAANGRAASSGIYVETSNPSPTTAPYVASYIPDQANYNANKSHGPKIPGASVYSSTNLKSHIARLVISENSLQHYRSDAPRRQAQSDDEDEDDITIQPNYAVEPRYSQSLHPKGEGGTTDFNTSDHNDDTPDNYSHMRTVDW